MTNLNRYVIERKIGDEIRRIEVFARNSAEAARKADAYAADLRSKR